MFRFFRRYGKDARHYRFVRQIFGVWASNIELYKLALVHRSASIYIDADTAVNNERLEFLGDAVLELLVSERLFVEHQQLQEGELTQLRSKIVCRATLNDLGRRLGLGQQIVANTARGSFSKQNMYGDTFEALCGALYLDQGFDRASRALLILFEDFVNIDELLQTEIDFKSRMLEWSQRNRLKMEFWSERSPGYSESNPSFETILMVDGERYGYGCSRNKKESEQKAACQAYQKVLQYEQLGPQDEHNEGEEE